MFRPRGAVIAEELEKLAKETEFAVGYQRVRTPVIAPESLYRKSGHLPYYAESMFPPMELKETFVEEGEEEYLRDERDRLATRITLSMKDKIGEVEVKGQLRDIHGNLITGPLAEAYLRDGAIRERSVNKATALWRERQ